MAFLNKRHSETPEVYRALVADLARTGVPTSIMGVTLVGVSLFAHAVTGSWLVLAGAICGGFATAAKLALMSAYLRREAQGRIVPEDVPDWESWHAATTIVVAASVGTVCTALFLQPDLPLQMLSTALVFGYCAGIVVRVSVRPRIAALALTIAALPPIVAAGTWMDTAHTVLAGMFGVFLLGSYETVRHVYRAALRHIQTQLDSAALARLDPLTNLPNRLGLREAFREAVARRSGRLAVHYFDLDGFKAVNDGFGHATGDALLAALACRVQELLPAGATVARLGGDEFVLLQPDLDRVGHADHLARRLVEVIRKPFRLSGREVRVGVSLGYVCAAVATADLDDLLRRADEAAYGVKRRGGGAAGVETPQDAPLHRSAGR